MVLVFSQVCSGSWAHGLAGPKESCAGRQCHSHAPLTAFEKECSSQMGGTSVWHLSVDLLKCIYNALLFDGSE